MTDDNPEGRPINLQLEIATRAFFSLAKAPGQLQLPNIVDFLKSIRGQNYQLIQTRPEVNLLSEDIFNPQTMIWNQALKHIENRQFDAAVEIFVQLQQVFEDLRKKYATQHISGNYPDGMSESDLSKELEFVSNMANALSVSISVLHTAAES